MENAEMRMNTAIVEVDRPWLAMSSMLIGAFVGMVSETSLNIALADAWQGLFSRNRHAAVARDRVHADDRHCAAVFKSDFKVVFNPSDHHLRFG